MALPLPGRSGSNNCILRVRRLLSIGRWPRVGRLLGIDRLMPVIGWLISNRLLLLLLLAILGGISCQRLLTTNRRLLIIILRSTMRARTIVGEAVRSPEATNAMTSNDTLAMTSIPSHAIRLHSSNWTEWSPATNRSIWPKAT